MPHKDPEYHKKYVENNREKLKEYKRQYYLKNKEKNKKHKAEYQIKYRKTKKGHKVQTLCSWKKKGILCFDWDLLYELYINTTHCEYCSVKLIQGHHKSNCRCLDHDHSITDKFNIRGVLCNSCNLKDELG